LPDDLVWAARESVPALGQYSFFACRHPYAPEFEKVFRRRQRPVGRSWWLDETYVKIKGKWAYLYRAVDKEGLTIDFLLTPERDREAAEAFLRKAIRTQGVPEKTTIDKSGSNTTAIRHYNKTHKTAILIRPLQVS
jgi:transposase-like protein